MPPETPLHSTTVDATRLPPRIVVRGRSMEPLLRDGDHLELEAVDADAPRVGELLVAATSHGATICHRVVALDGDCALLGGDRTRRLDRCPPATWTGRVRAAVRAGRRLELRPRRLDAWIATLHPSHGSSRPRGLAWRALQHLAALRWWTARRVGSARLGFPFSSALVAIAWVVVGLGTVAWTTGACSRPPGDPAPAAADGPLRIGVHSRLLALDPHAQNEALTFQTLRHVYEGLTGLDASSGVVPMLAERWESLDELRWRLTVRPARFHDGRTLRAEDVVWSLERARAPSQEMSTYLVEVESVRALDERSVELVTRRPYPILLAKLAFVAILPAGVEPSRTSTPIGTGRYRWIQATDDARGGILRLEAFDDHWSGTLPAYRGLEVHPLPDPELRREALLAGRVDVAQHLRPADAEALKTADCCAVASQPGLLMRYLAMHPERPPFDDPRVRRALDLALDRQALVDDLLLGYGSPHRQLVGRNVFGHDPRIVPRAPDLETARALLADAGHPDGLEVTLETSRLEPGAAVAAQLEAAGIRTEVAVYDWPEMVERLAAATPSLYLGGSLAVSADASDVLDGMVQSEAPELGYGGNNFMDLRDPALDELIEASGAAGDMERRRDLLHEAMAATLERRVYLGLYSEDSIVGLRRDLAWRARLDGFVFGWDFAPRPSRDGAPPDDALPGRRAR